MRETQGNLWDYMGKADYLLICSNCDTDSSGNAVMGAGVARQARDKWPQLPKLLGLQLLKSNYNPVFLLNVDAQGTEVSSQSLIPQTSIMAFPTKGYARVIRSVDELVPHVRSRYLPGMTVPGWARKSELGLIKSSALWVARHCAGSVVTTRPGCGLGSLSWEAEVKPLLLECGWNADRFMVVS